MKAGKGLAVLLPKLHKERCLLKFNDLVVQRGARKVEYFISFLVLHTISLQIFILFYTSHIYICVLPLSQDF
jgi:hypothetical protein